MEEAAAGEEIVWSLSPEARPVVPRPGWWEGRCVARPTANRGARPPSRSRVPRPFALASAATGTESPRPGRGQATVGGLRRAVSPPPARPQGRGRCQGDRTCSVRGLGPFRAPCIFAARPSQLLCRGRSKGAGGRREAPQPTCGPGPRHRGDKDTRNHHSRCCCRHRKRLSGSATTGRKLPLSRIWSLPPLHRPLPSPTPACHPAPTGERKCTFPDRMRIRKPRLGCVLA